jgi:hypothetical protein
LYESYLQENRKNINFYFRMAGHGQLFGRYLATKLYFSCLERHWNDYEQRKHKLTNDEIHEIRMAALIILVEQMKTAKTAEKRTEIYDFYLQ